MTKYVGTYFIVTDDAITPIGKLETWQASSREEAIAHALYTHRVHNGKATATPRGVIHCPSCGQIAITQSRAEQTS